MIWGGSRKKCLDFQVKQWITKGNCHPINLYSPILLHARNFPSWKIQKKMFVLFSVGLFQPYSWCRQPTKDNKSVLGSKMVYGVPFTTLENPTVTRQRVEGPWVFFHSTGLATLLRDHKYKLWSIQILLTTTPQDGAGSHSLYVMRQFAGTTDWCNSGFFSMEHFRILISCAHIYIPWD